MSTLNPDLLGMGRASNRVHDGMVDGNKGNALHELKQLGDAVSRFDRTIETLLNNANRHYNRGNALRKSKQFDAAVDSYEQAIEIKPDFFKAYCNRGIVLHELGQLRAAVGSYDKALAIKPDCAEAHFNKSLALLSNGDFEDGLPLYEWRWKKEIDTVPLRNFPQALWLGAEPLRGKTILLHSEQGFGDTIQFCRYAKLVSDLGAMVLLEVQKPLVGLLSGLDGVDELIEEGAALPAFDYHCPLLSLPLAFKTRLGTIPRSVAYLHADEAKRLDWHERTGASTKLKVGLVWHGGVHPDQTQGWLVNERRNIPLDIFASRLNEVDADFFSLQKGEPAESEIHNRELNYWTRGNFHNFADEIKDFSDTAALVANMDVVVSVDTSTAHLAAALGKPTWILNRVDSCWRWLRDRDDSPWYPSVRLYRQEKFGGWDGVLRRVAIELERMPRGKGVHAFGPVMNGFDLQECCSNC